MEPYAVAFTIVFAIVVGMVPAVLTLGVTELVRAERPSANVEFTIFLVVTGLAAIVITALTLVWASLREPVETTRTPDGPYPVIAYTATGPEESPTVTGTMLVYNGAQTFTATDIAVGERDEVVAVIVCTYYSALHETDDYNWPVLPWFPNVVCTVEYSLTLALDD